MIRKLQHAVTLSKSKSVIIAIAALLLVFGLRSGSGSVLCASVSKNREWKVFDLDEDLVSVKAANEAIIISTITGVLVGIVGCLVALSVWEALVRVKCMT